MIVACPQSLRLASSPEYGLRGRSLRTAMPSAFFCSIRTQKPLPPSDPRTGKVALMQRCRGTLPVGVLYLRSVVPPDLRLIASATQNVQPFAPS